MEETMRQLSLDELNFRYVLITGATGLIGQALVQFLIHYNREHNLDIQIIASGRNMNKLKTCFPTDYPYLHLVRLDVNEKVDLDFHVDYVIHTASITSSRSFVEKPVAVIETLLNGTQNILKLAEKKHVKSFVYLSSLEVYGVPTKINVSEADYGYIDFTKVRSSYSEGKRMAECICCAYASQYGIPVKIARLTQTIGAGIDYNDGRVFAQFARSVIEKKDIVLNTPGNTVRSYLGINDAVSAILTILVKGQNAESYNVANMATAISIKDLAQFVCDQNPEANIKIVFNHPENLNPGCPNTHNERNHFGEMIPKAS